MIFITKNIINLILGIIAAALLLFVIFLPKAFVYLIATKLTTGQRLSVEVYPEEIEVDSGITTWKIPLDGSTCFEEFNDMFLLYLPQEKLFIIPVRAIAPDCLADVQAIIISGTSPRAED